MGAPIGNKNAAGSRGGRRKSSYKKKRTAASKESAYTKWLVGMANKGGPVNKSYLKRKRGSNLSYVKKHLK